MGFGKNFCKNMAKRSHQYAVRSTYPLLDPRLKKSKSKKSKGSGNG